MMYPRTPTRGTPSNALRQKNIPYFYKYWGGAGDGVGVSRVNKNKWQIKESNL